MGSYHDEVVAALLAAAPDPSVGERIRLDRGSDLTHLGVPTPARRRIVRNGFTFSTRPADEVLEIWDRIWAASPYADVLFAVLDHYRESLRRVIPPGFWPVASGWIERVDNWAHADDLGRVYSWALAGEPELVLPTLREWNRSSDQWLRRISIVSLVHYSGPTAAFLPADVVLPLVAAVLDDPRSTVQNAAGWVLRELSRSEPRPIGAFLASHRAEISPATMRRATERLDAVERAALRAR